MIRVPAGIICCLAGIALVHQNRWISGLVLFIVGISLLMIKKRF